MGRSKESKHGYLIKLANDIHVSEMNRLVSETIDHVRTKQRFFTPILNNSFLYRVLIIKKAYELLNRTTLWNILQHYGIAENIINKIRLAYEPSTYQVHYRIIQYTVRSATRLHTLPKSLSMAVVG